MLPRGLKPGIIVNLLLLIGGAMLLVDLVMLGALRQELLRSRMDTGLSLMAITAPVLSIDNENPTSTYLLRAMKEAEATCLLEINDSLETLYMDGVDCGSRSELQHEAVGAIASGKSNSSFTGKAWGILWPDNKSLLVSYPFENVDGERFSLAIELSLATYYEALRNSQRAFAVYFLVNLFVLTLFGFYRLYRTLVKPINDLVSTAEEFNDNEAFSFSQNSRESEFNILSRSLNKMLHRINDDKKKLEESVRSLEKTNFELQQVQQEVVRAEKLASVGRLSAGIAHEIGNPVGIVIGYLDLLKQVDIPAEQKKDFLQRAEREVNRINTIIRQLLDFARQPQEDPNEIVGIHQVIHEVEEICRVQPLMSGIAISSRLDAENDMVFATAGQLKQIFINLLINAADAINSTGRDDGRVMISSTNSTIGDDHTPSVTIDFIDNGPGIETDQLQNIFDPFYTTKEPGKGTGLGLSICFTMVENLGGSIKASTGRDGMKITIDLPVVAHGSSRDKDKA